MLKKYKKKLKIKSKWFKWSGSLEEHQKLGDNTIKNISF